MSVRGASSLPKMHFSVPKAPKPKAPVIRGPAVAKINAPGVPKIPTLPSLSVQSRRGLAPRLQLAKAAAGASSSTRKRNPNYPTP